MKILRFAIALAFPIMLSGCSVQRTFTYPLEPIARISESPAPIKIAVLPAKDLRGAENQCETMWLGMIPLVPYGWVHVERPESASNFITIREFQFNAAEDFPKAIAQHLQSSGAAKAAFFDYGGGVASADYVLETELRQTTYDGKTFFYMLGLPGDLLWLIGLPAGSSRVHLDLSLCLKDKAGRVAWESGIVEDWGVVQGFYYNMRRDTAGFALTLQAGLDKALREKPLPRE